MRVVKLPTVPSTIGLRLTCTLPRWSPTEWFLLRVFRVHLHDRQVRLSRCHRLNHDTHERTGTAHTRGVRLPRRRNNRLPACLIRALNDGDFLFPARQKAAVLHFFHTHNRRVVLQQEGNREEIVHVFNHYSDRSLLADLQARFAAQNESAPTAHSAPDSRGRRRRRRSRDSPRLQPHRPPELRRPAARARRRRASPAQSLPIPYTSSADSPCPSGIRTIFGVRIIRILVFVLFVSSAEQVLQQRYVPVPASRCGFRVGLLDQTAQNVRFAFFQPNLVLDLSLRNNRLLNAADVRLPGHRRNFHAHLHAHFVVRVYARRNVHVHADVDVLELRVHQRVHESRARRRPTPTPAWKLPVATGTRSPILNFAGCPSTDRTSGF